MVAKQRKEPKQNIIYRRKLRPDYRLTDGQALPFFEDWKALHVPGHTLHDIVLYHQKTRTLYAADCILNVGGKFNLPIPVFFNGRMRQSLTRLKELDIATILLAHGDMLKPDNTAEIFDTMISLLDRPKNDIQKFYYNVSFFTPEFWRHIFARGFAQKKDNDNADRLKSSGLLAGQGRFENFSGSLDASTAGKEFKFSDSAAVRSACPFDETLLHDAGKLIIAGKEFHRMERPAQPPRRAPRPEPGSCRNFLIGNAETPLERLHDRLHAVELLFPVKQFCSLARRHRIPPHI
jgi:hypothetical protein